MKSAPGHLWIGVLCATAFLWAGACGATVNAPPGDAPAADASSADAPRDAPAPTDAGAGNAESASPDPAPDAFTPAPVLVPNGPLCDIPDDYIARGGDPTFIPCKVASDHLSDRDPMVVPAMLEVVAWNVEFGKDSAAVEHELLTRPEISGADFLLLAEVARASKTSNPQMLDQARSLATALKMNYVFAVEWDRRLKPDELGEHGVAILSKYPLGNVQQVRHTPLNDWYKEQQLYGGRITVSADALVGGKRMRLHASHLCTRGIGGAGRAIEGREARADADRPGRPALQVYGGDLNTWTCNPAVADCTRAPAAEKVVADFLASGWSDGTLGFNGTTQLGDGFFPQRLDWLFFRGTTSTPGARAETTGSDHFAIYTHLAPP